MATTYKVDVVCSELRIMTATIAIIIGLYHIKFFDSVFKLLLEEILSFEISLPVRFFSFTLTLHSPSKEDHYDTTFDVGFTGANKVEIKNEAVVSLKRNSEERKIESTAPILSPLRQFENYFSPNKLNVIKLDSVPVIPPSSGIINQSLEDRRHGQLIRGTSEIIENGHLVANILFSDGRSEVPLTSGRVAAANHEKIVSKPNFSSELYMNPGVRDKQSYGNRSSANATDLQYDHNQNTNKEYNHDNEHVQNNFVQPSFSVRDVVDKVAHAIFNITFDGFWTYLISNICHLSNLKGEVIIKDLRVCSPSKDIDPRWENENIITVKHIKVTFHFFRTLFYFVLSFGDFIYFEVAEVQGLSIFVEGYDEKNKNNSHGLMSIDSNSNDSSRDERNDKYLSPGTEEEIENDTEKSRRKEFSEVRNDTTDLNYYYNNIMSSININNISRIARECKVDGLLPLPLHLPLPFSTAISPSTSPQIQEDSHASAALTADVKSSSSSSSSCNTHMLNNKGKLKRKLSDHRNTKNDIILNISLLGASIEKTSNDIPIPIIIADADAASQQDIIGSRHFHGKQEDAKSNSITSSLLSSSFLSQQPVVSIGESRKRIDKMKDEYAVPEGGMRDGNDSSHSLIFPTGTDTKIKTDVQSEKERNGTLEIFGKGMGTCDGKTVDGLKTVQGRVVDMLPSNCCMTNIDNKSNITIGGSIFTTGTVPSSMNINSVSRIVSSNFIRSVVERGVSLRKDVDKVVEFVAAETKKEDTPYALFNTLCGQAKDQFSNDVRQCTSSLFPFFFIYLFHQTHVQRVRIFFSIIFILWNYVMVSDIQKVLLSPVLTLQKSGPYHIFLMSLFLHFLTPFFPIPFLLSLHRCQLSLLSDSVFF